MAKRKEEESFYSIGPAAIFDGRRVAPLKQTVAADKVSEKTNEASVRLVDDDRQPAAAAGVESASVIAEPPDNVPPPPSAEQQSAQADAYQQDQPLEGRSDQQGNGCWCSDLEVTFERFWDRCI